MEKTKEEISRLKEIKDDLDQQLEEGNLELEALKEQVLEVKVRRIVLAELLKKY